MGGGGQSSGGSTDWSSNLSQGGYNQPSQFNWGTLGQGLQRTGSAYAQGAGAGSYMSGVQYPASPNNPASVPNTLVPQSRGKNEETQALLDALRRIEAAAASKSKPIVPDKGAAKYWYVDPRAIGYDPMAAYNDEQGHDIANLGLLPAGTQPSF